VAIYLARFQLGPAFEFTFRYAPPLAYTYAAVIWLKAFYREEPTLPKAKPPAKNRLRAALRFIGKAKQDLDKGLDWLRLGFSGQKGQFPRAQVENAFTYDKSHPAVIKFG
jgi:hypothetical protein